MQKTRAPRNPRAGMKQTRFSCTMEEYQIIQREAEHAKLSVNEYVRRRALGRSVFNADKWLILAQLRAIRKVLWGWKHEKGITLDYATYADFSRIRKELQEALIGFALSIQKEGELENDNNQEDGLKGRPSAE